MRTSEPDLLVLDVMLPGMDGLEFLRLVRRDSDVPVILLSAKGAEYDRVLGLKLGADDYVVKPFSLGELLERVAARLRKRAPRGAAAPLSAGALTVDLERHEVKVKGRLVRLATKEFKLLALLIRADGKVLTREHLLKVLWDYDADLGIDTRTVDQHIARLRAKLGAAAARIATVPNFGYKFAR